MTTHKGPGRRYQRRADIRDQQVGAERMLLDTEGNAVHVLNATAACIWDGLKSPATVAEIEERLGQEFDLSTARDARASIVRVLEELREKGLVLAVSAASSRPPTT